MADPFERMNDHIDRRADIRRPERQSEANHSTGIRSRAIAGDPSPRAGHGVPYPAPLVSSIPPDDSHDDLVQGPSRSMRSDAVSAVIRDQIGAARTAMRLVHPLAALSAWA